MDKIKKGYYGNIKMEAEVEHDRIKVRVFRSPMLSPELERFFKELRISAQQTEVYTEIFTSLSGRHHTKEEIGF